MRVPRYWNDTILFENEPFRSFRATKSQYEEDEFIPRITQTLMDMPGSGNVIQAWALSAFHSANPNRPSRPQVDAHTPTLFVRIVRLMQYGHNKAALVVLNRERSARGLHLYGKFCRPPEHDRVVRYLAATWRPREYKGNLDGMPPQTASYQGWDTNTQRFHYGNDVPLHARDHRDASISHDNGLDFPAGLTYATSADAATMPPNRFIEQRSNSSEHGSSQHLDIVAPQSSLHVSKMDLSNLVHIPPTQENNGHHNHLALSPSASNPTNCPKAGSGSPLAEGTGSSTASDHASRKRKADSYSHRNSPRPYPPDRPYFSHPLDSNSPCREPHSSVIETASSSSRGSSSRPVDGLITRGTRSSTPQLQSLHLITTMPDPGECTGEAAGPIVDVERYSGEHNKGSELPTTIHEQPAPLDGVFDTSKFKTGCFDSSALNHAYVHWKLRQRPPPYGGREGGRGNGPHDRTPHNGVHHAVGLNEVSQPRGHESRSQIPRYHPYPSQPLPRPRFVSDANCSSPGNFRRGASIERGHGLASPAGARLGKRKDGPDRLEDRPPSDVPFQQERVPRKIAALPHPNMKLDGQSPPVERWEVPSCSDVDMRDVAVVAIDNPPDQTTQWDVSHREYENDEGAPSLVSYHGGNMSESRAWNPPSSIRLLSPTPAVFGYCHHLPDPPFRQEAGDEYKVAQTASHPTTHQGGKRKRRTQVIQPFGTPPKLEEFEHPNTTGHPGTGNVEHNETVPLTTPHQNGDGTDVSPVIQQPLRKVPLQRRPPIWSQSRQELCESFDWFKSYQGGVYHYGGVVKGYLLSAFSSSRDRFYHDGKLIISHGGGKAESLASRQGQVVIQQAGDQLANDKSVSALLATYRTRRPIVLLVDDKYALFPYDLASRDVTYAVLGYFFIAHAWAEYTQADNDRGRVVRYKFAFQWCDAQGEPWWITEKIEETANQLCLIPEGCTPRSNESPSPCNATGISQPLPTSNTSDPPWPTPGKKETVPIEQRRPTRPTGLYHECQSCKTRTPRVYSQSWMCLNPKCGDFWKTESGAAPSNELEYSSEFIKLQPNPLLSGTCGDLRPRPPEAPFNNVTTNYLFSRGWHCRSCGRLTSRFKWEHWECLTCGATLKIEGVIQSPRDLRTGPNVNFTSHSITSGSGITACPVYMLGTNIAEVQAYILPYDRGQIHHIRGKPSGNKEADEILQMYQDQATSGQLEFRRWPLKTHKLRGPLLANYFSQNSGVPYQYVGGSDRTVPFESAPSAVLQALKLIQERVSVVLNRECQFNEILSAAYMERQKMSYHSDNEKGLGPTVAGLSLGSPALMHFRLHNRYVNKNERKGNAISFVLRHGDILVMDGVGVQEYYEHTVHPMNFRIAATARHISSQG